MSMTFLHQHRHLLATAPLATVLALAPVGSPQAHRTWLVPSSSVVEGAEPVVTIDAAVSEDLFEYDTTALAIDGVQIVAPDGSPAKAENVTTARRRNSFDLKLTQPGTYRITSFGDTLLASYTAGGETKRWRGSPAAFAKDVPQDAPDLQVTRLQNRVETYVSRGRADYKPFTPFGVALELIPQTPATELSVGDTTQFRLVLDGQPVAGADVTILRGGNRYRYKMGEIALKTDPQGLFSVRWPEAGRYWIGASQGGRGPAGSAAQPARRLSVSATVEVLPE